MKFGALRLHACCFALRCTRPSNVVATKVKHCKPSLETGFYIKHVQTTVLVTCFMYGCYQRVSAVSPPCTAKAAYYAWDAVVATNCDINNYPRQTCAHIANLTKRKLERSMFSLSMHHTQSCDKLCTHIRNLTRLDLGNGAS